MTALELIPHPANGSDAVTSIVAHVRRRGDELTMLFRTRGARALVVWPGHLPQGFSDGLWRHTCFEAFVMAGARPDYVELNIAPSRRWAAYRFDGYRSGMRRAAAEPIGRIATYRFDTTVYARFRIPDLSPGAAWRVGVSAVIELHDGTRNYFALAHPEGNPDFHNPDCFIATLPAPAARMNFGIDRLLADPALRKPLEGRRVALLAHPASVTADLTDSLDALVATGINITAMFGPQHGVRGDLQDNMMESPDFTDPIYNIPVFSLYGEVRRPSGQAMGTFDTILIDLQDVGCRIYTFVTTLLYVLEAAAQHGKAVWVLDRPNPAGRPVEGTLLREGWESFVGAGPLPMRHGLTLGELGHWFIAHHKLDVEYSVIAMEGWNPDAAPGFGWPTDRVWINPSPNAANVNMARAYAGTVMLEGTTLSEGRGTTRPLELFGAPDIDARAVIAEMHALAPQWLAGCTLRDMWFQPTFHKHVGRLCHGVFLHAEGPRYDHAAFRPWRVQAAGFKAMRRLYPDYDLWRDFPYEYAFGKLAIDVINGGSGLREWVNDSGAAPGDLDSLALEDESKWAEIRQSHLIY